VRSVTNQYRIPYTPPILYVKSIQAETIIAAVEICPLALAFTCSETSK
jgi:hypothetical protein